MAYLLVQLNAIMVCLVLGAILYIALLPQIHFLFEKISKVLRRLK